MFTVAVDDVDDTRREACFINQVRKPEGRERGEFGWL
jgi:hypothetical protein